MQRHRGDHDDVPPGEQRAGRRVPQPLDLVVDRRVLLDVGVRLRDVRLGLVVVVVRDEVLDGVVGQQLAELGGQLRGERLVRRHHERRAAAAARSARPSSPTCRCRWRRAGRRPSPPPGSARSSSSIAVGWSPDGVYSEITSNGRDGPLEIGDGTHATTVRRHHRHAARPGAAAQASVPAGLTQRPSVVDSAARSTARAAPRRRRRRSSDGAAVADLRRACAARARTRCGPRAALPAGAAARRTSRCRRTVPAVSETSTGTPAVAHGRGARLDRQRREERGGRARDHRDVDRRRPVDVGDPRVDHVDRDALDADRRASAGLADAHHQVRRDARRPRPAAAWRAPRNDTGSSRTTSSSGPAHRAREPPAPPATTR